MRMREQAFLSRIDELGGFATRRGMGCVTSDDDEQARKACKRLGWARYVRRPKGNRFIMGWELTNKGTVALRKVQSDGVGEGWANIVSHRFGHEIKRLSPSKDYIYVDNGEPLDYVNPRPCKLCGERKTKEGHDPCIANLPGVSFACCGHGVEDDHCGGAYVCFENGRVIRGPFDHVAKMVHERQKKANKR